MTDIKSKEEIVSDADLYAEIERLQLKRLKLKLKNAELKLKLKLKEINSSLVESPKEILLEGN